MALGMQEQLSETIKARLKLFAPLFLIIMTLYIVRLWYLQIFQGTYYKTYSEKYRIRHERIVGNRGLIMDRYGTILVENRPTFHLEMVPEDCQDLNELSLNLQEILPQYAQTITEEIQLIAQSPPYKEYKILSNLNFAEIARLDARNNELHGVRITYGLKRYYPFDDKAAHIIGYMGKITGQEWLYLQNDERFKQYDLIGKSGIEKACNSDLTGTPTTITYEADALGKRIEILTPPEQRRALSGKDIQLTLDWDLQIFIEELMKGMTGAVVAMDPFSGEILAMVSLPTYDPNLFSLGISQTDWLNLIEDEDHPLINRCVQSAYPPGSIFKIITVITGLTKKVISAQTSFYCGGTAKFFDDYRDCWKKTGHGRLDLHKAIVNSCNIYMFNIAAQLDVDDMAVMAREFGLGIKTGIILPHEESGLIPSKEWKMRTFGQPWWQGETLSVALGQGSVMTTPLQLARMMAIIANGGYLVPPTLVLLRPDDHNRFASQFKRISIDTHILDIIRQGLRGVVNEAGGTAVRAQLKDIVVAGKTGTSQIITKEIIKKYGDNVPKKYQDHNWFACYAPYDRPRIALSVLIEHGGKEGTIAKLDIARRIIDYYLHHRPLETAPDSPLIAHEAPTKEVGP
ncbi:penicillin-binding protein 2 [bacterium]|nr:penicillin-binding protein 2 [bacterium]